MLSHIFLAGNYMGNSGVRMLAEGLRNNKKVMELDLTNNNIKGSEGAEAISEIISSEKN